MNYELAYRFGFHPWEEAESQAKFAERLAALLDATESGERSHGAALDLGTGSGVWAVWLAQRGWTVTAIEIVERALERAGVRASETAVDVRLVLGDVTNLSPEAVGSGFDLFLDTGTFHGLTETERAAMARGIRAIAAPGATLLVLAWSPRRRGPLPRGANRDDLATAFGGCEITDEGPSGFRAPPPVELLMRPDERWYRVRLK
jgi:SAM-dependent methyltransferase